jgi:endonuclease-3
MRGRVFIHQLSDHCLAGDVTCGLHHNSAWELVVATILSAACTDAGVNLVTPGLFRQSSDGKRFCRPGTRALGRGHSQNGIFRNKSKSIVGAARKLLSDFGGKAPDEMDSSRITGSRDRCTAAPVAILRAFS